MGRNWIQGVFTHEISFFKKGMSRCSQSFPLADYSDIAPVLVFGIYEISDRYPDVYHFVLALALDLAHRNAIHGMLARGTYNKTLPSLPIVS